MAVTVYDERVCALGEGPLWHPERGQFFWFDITGKRLLSRFGGAALEWQFDEHVSAAGWIDRDRLLVASETSLSIFDIPSGKSERLIGLEADNPITRSNDGRADPYGGFWIGTMGKAAEPGAGAIYRFFKGELRKLFGGISIPNATCFSVDGTIAFFADSATQKVMRQRLGAEGWPVGEAEVYLDLRAENLIPDGAVVDRDGMFWNAHWGAGTVCAYDMNGARQASFQTGAPHLTCPAFGGEDLTVMYLTSATEEMSAEALASHPDAGKTFRLETGAKGQAEHRILL